MRTITTAAKVLPIRDASRYTMKVGMLRVTPTVVHVVQTRPTNDAVARDRGVAHLTGPAVKPTTETGVARRTDLGRIARTAIRTSDRMILSAGLVSHLSRSPWTQSPPLGSRKGT